MKTPAGRVLSRRKGDRDAEIIRSLAEGASNAQVARAFGISAERVRQINRRKQDEREILLATHPRPTLKGNE